MDILEELDAAAAKGNPDCVEWLVRKYGEEQRDTITGAFNHKTASSYQIEAALRKRGIKTSVKTVQKHRRRECGCNGN